MFHTIKRIVAVVAVVFLLGLYVLTLISVLLSSEYSADMFKACIFSSVMIPILFYGYSIIFRLVSKKDKRQDEADQDAEK